MRLLTAREVLKANDLNTDDVHVPEWGDDACVRVKTLTCAEHAVFAKRVVNEKDDATVLAYLVLASAIDVDGSPLFAATDLEALLGKSSPAVKRIGKASMVLNGLNKDAVEDSRKNS